MSLCSELRTILLAESTVTAITERVFIDDSGQDCEFPYVIVVESNYDPLETIGEGDGGLAKSTIQIACVADRSVTATSLDSAVYNHLKNYEGGVIEAVHFQGRNRYTEQPDDGSQNRAYVVQQTYNIYHN